MRERRALYFIGPRSVAVRAEPLDQPAAGQLLVRTRMSAISAGTEGLFYRGEFPAEMDVDSTLPGLQTPPTLPMKYGYCAVGVVEAAGGTEHRDWVGRRVFSFHAHESAFLATPEELHPVPEGVTDESAALLPSMETAVGLVMDARPMLGEQVAVMGQGVVGLLTTALLARHPLASLVVTDRHALRRETAAALGATAAIDPASAGALAALREAIRAGRGADGADLCVEMTGSPAVLDQAIAVTGFDGRVVIGSWYGTRTSPLTLGGAFHRSRIRLISSQVSTLAPGLTGRWDKSSRLGVVWRWVEKIGPGRLVTHRFPLERAGDAYALLADDPSRAMQVVLTY